MSQAKDITELRRLNDKLRAEKEAAVERAAKRHTEMMHANRRAERAEQALNSEAWERQDDQVKATNLFCSYKETIKTLELGLAQAEQFGPLGERFQAVQAANVILEAALVNQKEEAAQYAKKSEKFIRDLQFKFDRDKAQVRQEAKAHYEERIAEMQKQLSEEVSRKVQAGAAQIQNAYWSCKAENDTLKKRLQEATQMIEWHKRQAQQQTEERACLHSPQGSAGIHAGFSLRHQHSPAQLKETANKRRTLDSIGNVGIPTPDQKRGRRNSFLSGSSATPSKKGIQNIFENQQQPITPTRQRITSQRIKQQQQRSNMRTSPLQQGPQFQVEAQSSPSHAQKIFEANPLFSNFFKQLKAFRLHNGQPQLSPQQAIPYFNQWFAQSSNRQSPAQPTSNGGQQFLPQYFGSPRQPSNQSAGLQLPFSLTATPVGQQRPLNMPLPCPNQADGTMQVQQIHPTHQQFLQQKQQFHQAGSQSTLQSPTISSQVLTDALSTSTAHDTTTPPHADVGNDVIDLAGQLGLEFQSTELYPFLEDSEHIQDILGVNDQSQGGSWSSPRPKDESETFRITAQTSFDSSNDQDFGSFFNSENFSTVFSTSMLPTFQHGFSESINQQIHNTQLQQHSRQHAVDPALLSDGGVQLPIHNNIGEHSSSYDHATGLQRPEDEVVTSPDRHLSQTAPTHPSTSRKRPAPPPSTRSTPTPSAPSSIASPIAVCLHCHENWWNASCDAGEPCQNCISSNKPCDRPKCLGSATGACTSARCPRVHEGDTRYRNVVIKPKTLKRIGKRGEAKPSPTVLAYREA